VCTTHWIDSLSSWYSLGETSLHYAVRGNRMIAVKYLLKSDADLSIRSKEGKRPIDLIEDKNAQSDIWEMLTGIHLYLSISRDWHSSYWLIQMIDSYN